MVANPPTQVTCPWGVGTPQKWLFKGRGKGQKKKNSSVHGRRPTKWYPKSGTHNPRHKVGGPTHAASLPLGERFSNEVRSRRSDYWKYHEDAQANIDASQQEELPKTLQ